MCHIAQLNRPGLFPVFEHATTMSLPKFVKWYHMFLFNDWQRGCTSFVYLRCIICQHTRSDCSDIDHQAGLESLTIKLIKRFALFIDTCASELFARSGESKTLRLLQNRATTLRQLTPLGALSFIRACTILAQWGPNNRDELKTYISCAQANQYLVTGRIQEVLFQRQMGISSK